jgi:glutamine synthetase
MGKRFDAEMFVDEIAKSGGHACDYLLTVDMEMEPVPGYAFANWELGYGDVHMVPDMATLRVASWLERPRFVVCDVKSEKTHDYVPVAPALDPARQTEARARPASRRTPRPSSSTTFPHQLPRRRAAGLPQPRAAGWYLEDYHILQGTRTEAFHGAARRHLKLSGVPVETSKGEWGLGQHELNVRYARRSRWPTARASSSSA